jgi:hypothetical protein
MEMERCLGENVAKIREVYKKMTGGGFGSRDLQVAGCFYRSYATCCF